MLLNTIAEAIWAEHVKSVPEFEGQGLDAAPAAERERIERYAHAALNAIAEPTPEMLSQGNRALQAWDDSEHYRSPITGIYRAMLSAELPPKPLKEREDVFDEL